MRVDGHALVVDMEPLVVELIRRRLEEAGFTTQTATRADDALRRAFQADPRFDVILVGDRLPDGAGMDLVHRLRSDGRTAGTSIAILTVMRDPEETFHMLESGADDCIRKPIHRVELIARVRSLLRIKRQLDELRSANTRLEQLNAELGRTATTDPLTRLANRRSFEERLESEVERSHRYGHPLSLLVFDIDHFKQVNDVHGHGAGDAVLREVAKRLAESVRKVDLAARYGGEEMVVIAPATGRQGATVLAERLRAAVESPPVAVRLEDGSVQLLPITTSGGYATLEEGQTPESLFDAADGALYQAKRSGRNRVVAAPTRGLRYTSGTHSPARVLEPAKEG